MKNISRVLAAALACSALAAPAVAADVGLSISIGQPGFFGRIDLGDAPPPQFVYRQPVWIDHPRHAPAQEPIYLHVPLEQTRNWRHYCRNYNACGQPVLFVRDTWYQKSYVPHYRQRNAGHDEGNQRDEGRGQGRDDNRGQNQRHD